MGGSRVALLTVSYLHSVNLDDHVILSEDLACRGQGVCLVDQGARAGQGHLQAVRPELEAPWSPAAAAEQGAPITWPAGTASMPHGGQGHAAQRAPRTPHLKVLLDADVLHVLPPEADGTAAPEGAVLLKLLQKVLHDTVRYDVACSPIAQESATRPTHRLSLMSSGSRDPAVQALTHIVRIAHL